MGDESLEGPDLPHEPAHLLSRDLGQLPVQRHGADGQEGVAHEHVGWRVPGGGRRARADLPAPARGGPAADKRRGRADGDPHPLLPHVPRRRSEAAAFLAGARVCTLPRGRRPGRRHAVLPRRAVGRRRVVPRRRVHAARQRVHDDRRGASARRVASAARQGPAALGGAVA